jgi:putative ABC transport system permease protein
MFKIALRNIFRNKRRSLLSLTIIGLGAAMLFLVGGFVRESLTSMEIGLAGSYGHLQIADTGYWDRSEEPVEYLLQDDRLTEIEAILSAHSSITSWTKQLDFSGLVGNAEKTAMVLGAGVEIDNPTLEPMDPWLVSGHSLEAGTNGILLGRLLAERLGVEPGDPINVAGFTVNETLNAMTVEVAGAFKYFSQEWEEQLTFLPLELVQRLLRTDGIDKVMIRLSGLKAVTRAKQELQISFDALGLGVEVKPWQDVAPFYSELKTFWEALEGLSTMGVFILAFFSIMQVLTMSFMERTREVGTIRAVGTKRRQVFGMLLTEGVLLGLLGGLFGAVLGFGLGALINGSNIGWMYPGATEPMAVGIQLVMANAIPPVIIVMISAFLSAIYPAWHAARTNVVTALHYV